MGFELIRAGQRPVSRCPNGIQLSPEKIEPVAGAVERFRISVAGSGETGRVGNIGGGRRDRSTVRSTYSA